MTGTIGAITGAWGTGMANVAGVEEVSFLNLYANLDNIPGLVIFGNTIMMDKASGKIVDKVTEKKATEKKDK